MKPQMKTLAVVVALSVMTGLTACSSVKKELGIDRNSPDEFSVVKRAPLTLPPDYTLRPPSTPDAVAAQSTPALDAEAAVMGTPRAATTTKVQPADKEFLGRIGVEHASPDIRRVIDEDNGYIALQNRTLTDKLVTWKEDVTVENVKHDRLPDSTIDAAAEAERIKKNQADGKPLNEGDVPVIEKRSSTLDKLF